MTYATSKSDMGRKSNLIEKLPSPKIDHFVRNIMGLPLRPVA